MPSIKTYATPKDILEGLNVDQEEAVRHDKGPLLIIAGAGTGKTTVITRRIAYIISLKLIAIDSILSGLIKISFSYGGKIGCINFKV